VNAPHSACTARQARPLLLLAAAVALAPCAEAQFVTPQVVLQGQAGPVVVEVEVARTPEEQQRGLMFRTELKPDAGMLFVYQRDGDHSFWMKNTYIPLDMIFITADGRVAGVVENAEPLTTTSRQVGTPSRYVLEVNAGFFRRHGIQPGSPVSFRGIPEAAGP